MELLLYIITFFWLTALSLKCTLLEKQIGLLIQVNKETVGLINILKKMMNNDNNK